MHGGDAREEAEEAGEEREQRDMKKDSDTQGKK